MSFESTPPQSEYKWKEDLGRFIRMVIHLEPVWLVTILGTFACFIPLLCRNSSNVVIIYVAQDAEFAGPMLREFEKETGIRVRAVFDSEAVKTVGLANRLLAEKNHPQCDVFWGNEEFRTRQLAAQNVFRETNGWVAFGARSRRVVINTNFVSLERRSPTRRDDVASPQRAGSEIVAPMSLLELTNAAWHGKVALAYPMFGTTSTHFHALRQLWGDAAWQNWCRALAANKPFLVDGNSAAAKLVARGDAWIGLTDSDDIAAEQHEGAPVAMLPLTPESLLIPNTVAVVRGPPHPEAAQRLFDYLQSRAVVERLVSLKALEKNSASEVAAPVLQPDWNSLLRELESTTGKLKEIFLR